MIGMMKNWDDSKSQTILKGLTTMHCKTINLDRESDEKRPPSLMCMDFCRGWLVVIVVCSKVPVRSMHTCTNQTRRPTLACCYLLAGVEMLSPSNDGWYYYYSSYTPGRRPMVGRPTRLAVGCPASRCVQMHRLHPTPNWCSASHFLLQRFVVQLFLQRWKVGAVAGWLSANELPVLCCMLGGELWPLLRWW